MTRPLPDMTSLDYYGIEELFTEDEREARDRARTFVREEVMSEVVPCHRAAKFPEHLIPRMGELGFYAPYLKEHGYTGLSHTAYGLIMQELERADSGLRSLASVQGALTIQAIHSFGSPEQHARWLPGLVSGERVGCFALTEHGHGSDPGGMETRARRDGDHYVLNGSKCWNGNAPIAEHKLVWMVLEITKAQLLALRLTRLMEAGAARPAQISLAKRNNVWMALQCARKARDILGAAGITDRYSVIRHLMNLESVSTYEGTHDIHTLIIGRDISGMDAFGG